jgi:8-oxo-dGTP diphosphatase
MGTPNPLDLHTSIEVLAAVFSLRAGQLCLLLVQPAGALLRHIPGAPLRPGMSLEETARERIHALTGLRDTYQEQLYTYGEPDRGGASRCVSVVYYALLPAEFHPPGLSTDIDAENAAWFPVGDLPPLSADHAEILAYALRRLRYKLEYSAVGFQLLPEVFTLSQLQKTYEIILGETLDKRNFRRRILEAGIIEATAVTRGGEGRPARLFRYRPDAIAEIKTRRLFP